MEDFKNIFGSRQNRTNLIVLLLIAISLPVALYLVSQTQIFRSRADSGGAITFVGPNVETREGKTYLKPIKVDPNCQTGCEYRYSVGLKLNPPTTVSGAQTDAGFNYSLIKPAYAQSVPVLTSAQVSCQFIPANPKVGDEVKWIVTYPGSFNGGGTARLVFNDASNVAGGSATEQSIVASSQDTSGNWKAEFFRTYTEPTSVTRTITPQVQVNYLGNTTPLKDCPSVTVQTATVTSPSPAASPRTSCEEQQTCTLAGTEADPVTGTRWCRFPITNGTCTTGAPTCTISATSPTPGCGVFGASMGLTCKPDITNAGINQPVNWKVEYDAHVSGFVQSITFADGNGSPVTITNPGTGPNSQNKYTATFTRTYPTPFNGKPTVSMLFKDSKGALFPFECDPLTVGASTVSATIGGDANVISGREGTFSVSAEDGSSDPNIGISKVEVYALKADGSSLSENECGDALINGNCRVFSANNLTPGQKTYSNSSIKWSPNVPDGATTANYYLYATVDTAQINSSTPVASCSGKRGSTGTVPPCSGTANFDVGLNVEPAYTAYAAATNTTDLTSNPVVNGSNISSWPQEVTFPPSGVVINDWQSPGTKTVYVRFTANTGQVLTVSENIELVAPDPVIRQVTCNLSVDGREINFILRGYDFGPQTGGKITALGLPLNIKQWKNNQTSTQGSDVISASGGVLPPEGSDNYSIEVVVSRADGAEATTQCTLGTSTISIGAKTVCRLPTNTTPITADLVIADGFDRLSDGTRGKVIKSKVTINPDGTITGIDNAFLQSCNYYKLSLKAPLGVRQTVEFQALDGTTVIPDFKLPIGDIFPVAGDGAINSFDVSELIRQWSASPNSVRGQSTATDSAVTSGSGSSTSAAGRTGDLNGDGVVNSFDFSCMVTFFNMTSDPEPTPGPVDVGGVGDFCADDSIVDETGNIQQGGNVGSVSVSNPTNQQGPSGVAEGVATAVVTTTNRCDSPYFPNNPNQTVIINTNDLPASSNHPKEDSWLWFAIDNEDWPNVRFFAAEDNNRSFTAQYELATNQPFPDADGQTFTLEPNTPYRVLAYWVRYDGQQIIDQDVVGIQNFTLNACPTNLSSPSPSPSPASSPSNITLSSNLLQFACESPQINTLTIGSLDGLNITNANYDVYLERADGSGGYIIGIILPNGGASSISGFKFVGNITDVNGQSVPIDNNTDYILKLYQNWLPVGTMPAPTNSSQC